MEIKVEKLTDVRILHEANEMTTGKESCMSLLGCYRAMHSNARTQIFWIRMYDIPLFVASQFVRSHVGVQWYMRSKRTDRGGENFGMACECIALNMEQCINNDGCFTDICERDIRRIRNFPNRFDRYAPTDLGAIINAEAIMNMSHKRLCTMASFETREIWGKVLHEISKVDSDLVKFCVMPCVANGGICREPKGCGYNKSEMCAKQIGEYRKLFVR